MANNKAAIELRRNRTMQLLLDGTSYRKIAAALGVSLGTVQNDIRRRLNEIRTEGEKTTRQYRAEQLARYEQQLRTWSPMTRYREVEVEVEIPDPHDSTGQRKLTVTKKVSMSPDPKAAEIVLRTLERIDLLLGVRIPPPKEIPDPEPVDLNIRLVRTGALDQIEDPTGATDAESEEVIDGP